MAEDNVFTFDTGPFMNGLKKVSSGMAGLQKGAANMAKSVSRGVINAAAKIGLLKLAFSGVKAAIAEMPEIGQTFKIAKDVIMKNLLFPLRKAVFPLLQKFLNWVRDNRAMFVKWGQTVANVFEAIVGAVGEVMKAGEKMFQLFFNFVNRAFGTNIKNMNDLLNLLTFKFIVVLEFLKSMMGPVVNILNGVADIIGTGIQGAFNLLTTSIDGFLTGLGDVEGLFNTIVNTAKNLLTEFTAVTEKGNSIFTIFNKISETFGKVVRWLVEIGASLVDGFLPHIQPILDAVQDIADAFGSIFDSIFGSDEAMKDWKGLFEFIGNVVGGTLKTTFETIAGIIKGIDSTIKAIKDIFTFLQGGEVGKDFGKNATDAIMGAIKFFNPTLGAQLNNPAPAVNDAIVTSGGRVIPVNSQDDLLAYKPGGPIESAIGGGGAGSTINVDFRGMQIVVQEGTASEGQRMAESLVDQMRTILNREFVRNGG